MVGDEESFAVQFPTIHNFHFVFSVNYPGEKKLSHFPNKNGKLIFENVATENADVEIYQKLLRSISQFSEPVLIENYIEALIYIAKPKSFLIRFFIVFSPFAYCC